MFKQACAFALLIPWATAGTLEGITLENLTSFPLARTRLVLSRLEGDRFKPVATAAAARDGRFFFAQLEEGIYQVTAARSGFAETKTGQRGGNGQGVPIFISRDGSQFVELRLKRLGLITGRIVDENRVGLGHITVRVYTSGAPSRIVSSGTSDDLGLYRITGLPAGKYLVRTDVAQTEDTLNLLPTYYPFASVLRRDARSIGVELDAETTDIDIQPAPGKLSSVSVSVTGCLGLAQVTLTSDAGRRQSTAPCGREPAIFTALASGDYELLAEGDADQKKLAEFTVFHLVGDHQQFGVHLRPLPDLKVSRADGTTVILRRRDPAGEAPEFPLTSDRIALTPGYWQITARPPAGSYLADIRSDAGAGLGPRRDSHPEWFEFPIDSSTQVNVSISPRQAKLSGRVISSGKEAIAAPVYLIPTTPLGL